MDILDDNILRQEGNQKTELDVLKELFEMKNVETKTELSIQQIILINQKRTIAKLIKFDSLDNALNDFMFLMVSHRRRGRSEFVDGFKSERENKINQANGGFFSSMKNKMGLWFNELYFHVFNS